MTAVDSLYVAGPMTWVPQFNIPMFERVAKLLRSRGIKVISPAELDSQEIRAAALASEDGDPSVIVSTIESYGEILGRDVTVIIDRVAGIVLLPGWENSTGATIEVCTAIALDRDLWVWDDVSDILMTLSHRDAWTILEKARNERYNHKRFTG